MTEQSAFRAGPARRRAREIVLAAVLVALSSATVSAGRSPDRARKGDPAAYALFRKMYGALRDAKTLSLESEFVWETNGEEIGRSSYELRLGRPNLARLESRSGDGSRTGIIVVDGRDMWVYWPTGRPSMPGIDSIRAPEGVENTFIRQPAPAGSRSIGGETNTLGTGMSAPILDPSIFHGLADPMEPFLDEVRSIGISTVDGEICDIVVAEYDERKRSRAFWIARSDGLPRRLIETVRLDREIVKREHWRKVSVNAAMPRDLFSWRPPAGWEEYLPPTLHRGLLPPGSVAPDFTVALLDGASFTLSEQRGKTVWLCFWRLACPPCRVELPHLERLRKRHGKNGLVVLGVNFADDRGPALEYLRKESIGFANAVDTSAAVQDLYYRRYQTLKGHSAVPLNYIIDPEGRVADAWYGYEKGSGAGNAALKRLGVIR